jgi:hypothetical protein
VLKIADRRRGLSGRAGGRAKRVLDGRAHVFVDVEIHLHQVSGKIRGDCHGWCFSRNYQGCIPTLLPYREALWV